MYVFYVISYGRRRILIASKAPKKRVIELFKEKGYAGFIQYIKRSSRISCVNVHIEEIGSAYNKK